MTINQITISNTADTTIVPAPSGTSSFANVGIFFCNHSTAVVTLQVYLRPTAGAATDANSLMRDLVLQPKETFVLNAEKFLLGTGNYIVARASADNSVVATATYIAI
jgi:hypothetical protein